MSIICEAPLLEVPDTPAPDAPLPDGPVGPDVPPDGPAAPPVETPPDGPAVPVPAPPTEPQPGAPDVPTPDPVGPEIQAAWAGYATFSRAGESASSMSSITACSTVGWISGQPPSASTSRSAAPAITSPPSWRSKTRGSM